MTAANSSLLRRTILVVAVTAIAFGVTLNAQDQSANPPCEKDAEILIQGPTHYCINKHPAIKMQGESPELFQKRWGMWNERLQFVHNLIYLRFAIEQMQVSVPDNSDASAEFEKMRALIDPLCKPNFCTSAPFTGFPPKVAMTRAGLLEFIRVATARCVYDQASPGVIDLTGNSLRINQIQRAIQKLIADNSNNEVASR